MSESEKKEAVLALGDKIDDLLIRMDDGETLAVAAASLGLEVKSTGLVQQDKMPGEFSSSFRNASGTASDAVFQAGEGTSKVHGLGDDQWIYFQVEEVVEPAELSFEEAKEQVKEDLVKELAMNAMKAEAEEKHQAITTALEQADKTFAEVSKELELAPMEVTEATTIGIDDGRRREYAIASTVNPGKLSEVTTDDNEAYGPTRSFFVYVEKREVEENPAIETVIDMQLEQRVVFNRRSVVANWFSQQRAIADFQTHRSR